MIRVIACVVLVCLALAKPTSAQSAVYAGASGTAITLDASSPSLDTLGVFAAAGGFVGLRLHDAWSLEVHLDRAFGESAERERLEGFGRSVIQDHMDRGFALLAVWKRAVRNRVGLGATFGIATRALSTHRVRTIVTHPDDPSVASIDRPERDGGAGWTGGLLVPIRLAGGWSLAPELRVAMAVTGERGGWVQIAPGARVMWGF